MLHLLTSLMPDSRFFRYSINGDTLVCPDVLDALTTNPDTHGTTYGSLPETSAHYHDDSKDFLLRIGTRNES
ncbi:hypothetical protein TNIN_182361 [Trichonephila inaurata madagascariensis]|uniref:Uncharacterized protein n=1 Tax=Trichonephila inaurata madagascariensis TaxID=2747483 RepID=A0A8X6YFZ7_9ARAC|nr:hypothetical protein TNIN_254471 [Trichonephila inaurata madagascariensis]GFY68879.1 hypothetical protein TNIN_182361 [Trichonephila inaurata madagascariensis]